MGSISQAVVVEEAFRVVGGFHEAARQDRQKREDVIAAQDLVVVTTAHKDVDYGMVQKNAKAVFDTKNAMKDIESRTNIEVL